MFPSGPNVQEQADELDEEGSCVIRDWELMEGAFAPPPLRRDSAQRAAFLIKTPGKANLDEDFASAASRFGVISEVYCERTLTCHRVWRSAPALEYILAGRESVCGCINVCQAPRLRADLANGRRFHAAEMQPYTAAADLCTCVRARACSKHGRLIGAKRAG